MGIHAVRVDHADFVDWQHGRTQAKVYLTPTGPHADPNRPFLVCLNDNSGFPHPRVWYCQHDTKKSGIADAESPVLMIQLFFPDPVALTAKHMIFFVGQDGADGMIVARF